MPGNLRVQLSNLIKKIVARKVNGDGFAVARFGADATRLILLGNNEGLQPAAYYLVQRHFDMGNTGPGKLNRGLVLGSICGAAPGG